MQGIGVRTPRAAAVAAATIGFAMFMHVPNGVIFMNGMWFIIVAIGIFFATTQSIGGTIKGVGAAPNTHLHNPERIAGIPIILFSPLSKHSGLHSMTKSQP
jgi:hypothetical protein